MDRRRSLTELTEERMTPDGDPMQMAWHRARYRFALPFVDHKRVLDAGSGEGYGTATLAERAREVMGVDYSPAAVKHANSVYGRPGLRFEVADLNDLSSIGQQFDVVTCFEVIEHIADPAHAISTLADLLVPGGQLVLSTPNGLLTPADGGYEYHFRELAPHELRRMLRARFHEVKIYGQVPTDRLRRDLVKSLVPRALRTRALAQAAHRGLRVGDLAPPRRSDEVPPAGFRFNRWLARNAFVLVAVAQH